MVRLSLAVVLCGVGFSLAADGPVPTKDAAAKMTVPPGFHVTLFAGEPDVVQPIAFTFDDRGRMWVVECVTYPKWIQPGQPGKDRVVILEDTDGDGIHDKKTVVLNNGVNLSGIELGFGGVYLCSTPNLIFIPIKDDKPSGPPQVLLDGWNLKDAKHNVFNGLAWGPDGWLYGCNGIQTKSWVGAPGTPQDKRTFIDCGVWRFHPTRKVFDVVATGTTNPWGLDWDDRGEMFITNCVIDHLFHVVPGGKYQRMYGQDINTFVFGQMSSCVDYKHWAGGHWTESRADKKTGALQKQHDDAGGGHAHSGAAIYLGDNFPPEYRNTLFTCNIHGARLNNDGLAPTASGMKGVRRPDFLFANDPWFRGICVKQGPDGGLYVSDWCDTGECHNYDVADITNGRIYRVIYGDRKSWKGDVSKMTDQELWDLQGSKNEWLVRKARRVLQERYADGSKGTLPAIDLVGVALGSNKTDESTLLRQIWTRFAAGGSALYGSDKVPLTIRIASARLLAETFARPDGKDLAERALVTLSRDDSPAVRMAVAGAMIKLPASLTLASASKLLSHSADNADANLTQMYWLGIQPAVLADPAAGLKLLPEIQIRRVRSNIVRLVLSLPKSEPTKQLDLILPVLAAAKDDDQRADILSGILAAFDDRKQVVPPAGWATLYMDKLATSANAALATEVALKFGDDQAVAMLAFQATHHREPADRIWAIEKLAPLKKPDLKFGDVLRKMLTDPAVRGAAVRGLAHYPEPETAPALLTAYRTLTPAERADAITTLTSRKDFAHALLDAMAAGTVPKTDVSAFAARQVLALNDRAISAKLETVWGTIRPASATRATQAAKLKALLTPDALKAADKSNGRAVYTKSCAACHKLFGDGGDVGPELTGAQRTSLDYLFENVLDPNAVVPSEYKMTAFYLHDGRLVTGLVKKETPAAVTVRTVNEAVVIPLGDIESRKATQLSVMPEGLLDALSESEIRDLIAYLSSPAQVPMPGGK